MFLLDSNVLISLCVEEHIHFDRATRWLCQNPQFAVCPFTEASLIRLLKRTKPKESALPRNILNRVAALPGYMFWPADIPHGLVSLESIRGHQQVTDAYLVALAAHHGGKLATFDEALVAFFPEAYLIPSV